MDVQQTAIFQRLLKGEGVLFNDPDYYKIIDACNDTRKLLVQLNAASDPDEIRNLLWKIIGVEVHATTMVFPPFQINYGKNTKIGKNVFINFDCTFLDLGGITIDDNVMLAPNVSLLSEGHPIAVDDRQTLTTGSIHIKRMSGSVPVPPSYKASPSVRMLLWRREQSCQRMSLQIQLLAVYLQKQSRQFNNHK